jgi:secreted PhoX family phosphatase
MMLTNSKLHRRQFLRTAIATAGGIAALPAPRGLGPLTVNGRVYAAPGNGGYGALIPTADERDGGVRMALPEGFNYRSFSLAGDTMSDGNLVPLAHDGMGVFKDNGSTSGFYRFLPATPGVLANGGVLEMLAIDGQPNYDTRTGQIAGVALPVTWVPIANPNPAGTSSTAVYNQGRDLGAARFARLEGCWYGNGAIYFDSSSGGSAGVGQIWEFRPEGDGGTLTLIFESPSAAVLDAPDDLAFSPQGSILLCEDGGGDQYMRGVTLDGEIFDFALNLQNDYEWAGATFAEADSSWNDVKIRGTNRPLGSRWDRVTLFVNRQGATGGTNPPLPGNEGMTFAIWGPWKNGAL